LGIQAFDGARLAFLGRRHGPERARESIAAALAAGFRTVSVDLIYGLPEEEPEAWRRELEQAVAAGPHHLSCYQLTIHEGTPFGFRQARGRLTELSGDRQGELFRFTHRFLADHGYEAYEVSNFARAPEHRSRHNRKYWDGTPYLGLGPSAHSFDGRRRFWNHRKLGPWQRALVGGEKPVAGEEVLSPTKRALEELMLAFRTTAGLHRPGFRRRFGIDLVEDQPAVVDRLVAGGLLTVQGGHLRPTLEGLAVADSLALAFDLTGI
jgi:oxygen-independent coproporphyrinogen-3 oxidase